MNGDATPAAADPPTADAGQVRGVPPARFAARLVAARSIAEEGGIAALLVGVGADLRYLTGYVALPMERLTMLVVPVLGPPRLIVPRLEALPARGCPAASAGLVEVVAWEETDDPVAIVAGIVRGSLADGGPLRLALSDRLWAMFVLGIEAAMPDAELGLASAVLGRLRIVKDDDEIRLLRSAAEAADRVVAAIAAGPLVGRTEADVAREIRERLVAEGHESAEFAIVASGPNSASPHHEASDRVIQAGEPIVLDIGGLFGGYGSDTTRTIWVTGGDAAKGPDDEFRRIHALAREAQGEATGAARPGVRCERVDAVARGIITAGGYGEQFIHRVGHGIGLDGHEDPYLVDGNDLALEPGMVFSIEPGIYLEGRYGCRIEDIVVCSDSGPVALNGAPRDLLVVNG
jgi:Xaa-Pro aminopeptidase